MEITKLDFYAIPQILWWGDNLRPIAKAARDELTRGVATCFHGIITWSFVTVRRTWSFFFEIIFRSFAPHCSSPPLSPLNHKLPFLPLVSFSHILRQLLNPFIFASSLCDHASLATVQSSLEEEFYPLRTAKLPFSFSFLHRFFSSFSFPLSSSLPLILQKRNVGSTVTLFIAPILFIALVLLNLAFSIFFFHFLPLSCLSFTPSLTLSSFSWS